MPTLYLVRHAKPAATWGEDPDPGLDETGHSQARTTAQALRERLDPLRILTSPLRRCRETATPLEQLWNARADVFPAVAEIPSPPLGLAERHAWLKEAMAGTWTQMQASAPPGSPDFLAWRAELIAAVKALNEPSVIYTHFIAINALVGAAQGSDDVVCFRPDHASITVIETDSSAIRLIDLGRQAVTSVLTRN
jgi:broad specificity phosphatase PhoE